MGAVEDILEQLEEHPPRYGPEWGSGGIFGLKYYRRVLYYTVAFEAEAYFLSSGGRRIYRFEHVGSHPVSGGDTYNAVETVDNLLYFGGWVHAPAVYKGRSGRGLATISFKNKYSHVHYYDTSEDEVKLLWKESIRHEYRWAGEVSEIVYDPYGDRLLIARADGHERLGLYSLDRRSGRIERIDGEPVLKGGLYLDHACFANHRCPVGTTGIVCLDLIEDRVEKIDLGGRKAIDNAPVEGPQVGCTVSSHGRFFVFVRGGVIAGNPVDEAIEPMEFIRFLDMGASGYGPLRTMAKPYGGGVLVAFNAYTNSVFYHVDRRVSRNVNTIVGPSVLVYISPPTARIVGAYGARVTGFERVGDKLVVAANTMANLAEYDVSPFDMGYRGFVIEDADLINRPSPPVTYSIPGYLLNQNTFGGIPLAGYRRPVMIVKARDMIEFTINSYTLQLPSTEPEKDTYRLDRGINRIELSMYTGLIVSFTVDKKEAIDYIRITLN